jgi:hypothetical protein
VERQVGSARWTRWPNEIKCGPYGGKKSKTKSGTVSWLSSKPRWIWCRVAAHNRSLHAEFGWFTPQNQHEARTTWQPSHEWDWREGCTESAWFVAVHHKTVKVLWLSHKAKTEDSVGGGGIWVCRETSKEDTRRDRKACVEVKRGAVTGHPSDGATMRIPKVPFGGMYPSIM